MRHYPDGIEWMDLINLLRAHGLRPHDKVTGIMLTLGWEDRGLHVTEISPGKKVVYTCDANEGNQDVREAS